MSGSGETGGSAPDLVNSGEILSMIATGAAWSRAALLDGSGLSRATVAQRLNALIASGLVRQTARTVAKRGRPTYVLTVNETAGFVLTANIGEAYIHLAAIDLGLSIVADAKLPFRVAEGPADTLQHLAVAFSALAERVRATHRFLLGISLSLPTPVDFKRGRVVGPSVLLGWDEFAIQDFLGERFDVPVYIENDVNLMAIHAHREHFPSVDDMVFIKAGTGIGSGIIANGRIYRGAQGAAGDVGHIQFDSDDAPLCRCGKFGCVEAHAAGWAIARDLTQMGIPAANARDVIELVDKQKPEAIMLLRKAGRVIGEAVSDIVSVLNPAAIVIGGTLARGGDFLLLGIRELVYQRCLPLATRELTIMTVASPEHSAVLGAARLALDDLFSPAKVDALIGRFDPLRAA